MTNEPSVNPARSGEENESNDVSTSREKDELRARDSDSREPRAEGEGTDALASTETLDFEPRSTPNEPASADVESDTKMAVAPPRRDAADDSPPPRDPRDEFGPLKPGSNFGQFHIVRFIGGGGMGRVYEGVDLALERKVAIKVLPRRRAQDAATVARFLNEAKSAARLNHENIAQVYLFGNVDGIPYIAFEYVDGENLRDYVRDSGALNLNEAIDYVLQAADALAHAAAHGVTHRDVKPSNIIITPQKRVKLIDMGLARLLKTDDADDLTESGVTLGTFDYISPEQARDPRLADVRSDVYSLGCTFYYMLVGKPPFPEGTMLQKLLMHQGDEAPDVRDANPSAPFEIAAVVKKMMKKDPNERYQTPEALIADLRQIVDLLGLSVKTAAPPTESPLRNVSHVVARVAPAVVALAALIGIVAVVSVRSKDELALPTIPTAVVAPATTTPDPNVAETNPASENASAPTATDVVAPTPDSTVAATPPGDGERVSRASENAGGVFEGADLDATYLANGLAALEKSPALLAESARDALKNFLADGDSQSSTQRAAFAWRARAVETPRAATVVAVGELGEGDFTVATSRSITAYSFLSASAQGEAAPGNSGEAPRVVDGRGATSNSYATLQGALAAPSRDPSGEIRVELRIDGALEIPSTHFADKKVEIFAAEGRRPTLVFKPTETTSGGWSERMFLLDSSTLTLRNVNVDFTVPSQDFVASEWSVFESVGGSSILLEDSTITVRNMTGATFTAPLHSNVAFFRLKTDDGLAANAEGRGDQPLLPSVKLERVFARGEATVFAVERFAGLLEASSCGFCSSGSFIHATPRASAETTTEAPPATSERLEARATESIVACRSSFLRVDADSLPSGAIPLELEATRSILRLYGQPLALANLDAAFDEDAFARSLTLSETTLLDASSLLRLRVARSEPSQDYPLPIDGVAFERAELADLNADAQRRLETLPPHEFSTVDFYNWLLSPIHTSSQLSATAKSNADEIKRNFVDLIVE